MLTIYTQLLTYQLIHPKILRNLEEFHKYGRGNPDQKKAKSGEIDMQIQRLNRVSGFVNAHP